jgi:Na+-translocating ferredoxin:NAD+ oxidoreductase RnfE subunit
VKICIVDSLIRGFVVGIIVAICIVLLCHRHFPVKNSPLLYVVDSVVCVYEEADTWNTIAGSIYEIHGDDFIVRCMYHDSLTNWRVVAYNEYDSTWRMPCFTVERIE